jgi:hypothetical protein
MLQMAAEGGAWIGTAMSKLVISAISEHNTEQPCRNSVAASCGKTPARIESAEVRGQAGPRPSGGRRDQGISVVKYCPRRTRARQRATGKNVPCS